MEKRLSTKFWNYDGILIRENPEFRSDKMAVVSLIEKYLGQKYINMTEVSFTKKNFKKFQNDDNILNLTVMQAKFIRRWPGDCAGGTWRAVQSSPHNYETF